LTNEANQIVIPTDQAPLLNEEAAPMEMEETPEEAEAQ